MKFLKNDEHKTATPKNTPFYPLNSPPILPYLGCFLDLNMTVLMGI